MTADPTIWPNPDKPGYPQNLEAAMGAEVDTGRDARLTDHRHIWLQHKDDADPSVGRMWCQDKVWPETHSDKEPTQYVRADLVAALEVERDALLVRAEAAEKARDAAIAERDQARALLTRAEEEMRLIRMKDTGAVYDIGLRAEIRAAMGGAKGSPVMREARAEAQKKGEEMLDALKGWKP